MLNIENYRYAIVKKNGKIDIEKNHISKEEADNYLKKATTRGWDWTIKKYTDEEMAVFVLINNWMVGNLS